MNEFFDKNKDYFFVVFRVIIGVLFIMHGMMKIDAILALDVSNLMFYAGLIEIVGGAFVALGLFTRIVASISALEMAYAYIVVHFIGSGKFNPVGKDGNGGELSLIFLVAFLVIAAFGARAFSLDKALKR